MLTPIFLQSNFGIVTACVFKLMPRPEAVHILYATLAFEHLEQGLACLKQLRADQTLNSVIKLYNAQAFHAYSGQQAAANDKTFHLMCAIYGSETWVKHVSPFAAKSLKQSRSFDSISLLDRENLTTAPPLIQALAQIYAGQPTRFAVQKALALSQPGDTANVDQVSQKGLLFIIPVVPLDRDAILQTLNIFGDFSTRYNMPINSTINILSENAVEMVSSITFQRTPEHIKQAHQLKQAIVAAFNHHGIPLMRLDIDAQDDTQLFTQPNYRNVLDQLKHLFDPNNIIAPGRYI